MVKIFISEASGSEISNLRKEKTFKQYRAITARKKTTKEMIGAACDVQILEQFVRDQCKEGKNVLNGAGE